MQTFTWNKRMLVGLTLFSMFFGAGNLIFPPYLGYQAGSSTPYAFIGFILTAVAAPILAVATVALSSGLDNLASRVSKVFASIFILLIYLSIGPMLAIPRTASVSFEMALKPYFLTTDPAVHQIMGFSYGAIAQFIYSIFFFALAYFIALNPDKLTQRLGKFLSPALLILIAVVFLAVLFHPVGHASAAIGKYTSNPVIQGFLDGYQTMDTLAALNFGLIIAMNVKALGATNNTEVAKETIKAGIIAGMLMVLVYAALSYIGMLTSGNASLGGTQGADTLRNVAMTIFGYPGQIVLGAIFFIACLNTCIGLFACCSNYFCTIMPKVSYKMWLLIFAVISVLIANMGLAMILKVSIPILFAIYPLALVLIFLGLMDKWFGKYKYVYAISMLFTGIMSVSSALTYAKLLPQGLVDFIHQYMPLSGVSLEWLIPAIIGMFIGIVLGKKPVSATTADHSE